MFSKYTYKVRVPVGRLILELPAGMVDDEEGDVVGTAVREVINILYFKPFGVIMLRL